MTESIRMDEIDSIIIESLKQLKCNIDDVKSIKEFDPNMIVDAIVSCLEIITPGIKVPHKLSPSMSLRLKLATNLSDLIKELGFRGDIGYQTILYCNEIEVRRVLMFLIERLPREIDDNILLQQTGYVYNLTKKIQEKVKLSLEKPWIPISVLRHGMRECGKELIKSSCNYTYPIRTENIQIPLLQNSSENLKEYWIYNVNDVTKQCSDVDLIPSLLFRDCDFENVNLCQTVENSYVKNDVPIVTSRHVNPVILSSSPPVEQKIATSIYNIHEDKIQKLSQTILEQKQSIQQLKHEINLERSILSEVSEKKDKEEEYLKDLLTKYKIKSRTLTVLSKEENLIKLKKIVQNGNERLIELESQWKEVETPLINEYETLIGDATAVELKQQKEQERIKNITEKKQQLLNELAKKDKLEKLLKEEHDRLSKNTKRSAHTRRILEIIGNINKQNEEIQKILSDTKIIQKDINTLNGQLDRSFTLSDELIFRNAKQDEMSRKAYKLLAALHNDCGAIIQAITEMGVIERESRNLQEQIDIEVGKATGISLERVNTDIKNVKKEIAALMEQTHIEK